MRSVCETCKLAHLSAVRPHPVYDAAAAFGADGEVARLAGLRAVPLHVAALALAVPLQAFLMYNNPLLQVSVLAVRLLVPVIILLDAMASATEGSVEVLMAVGILLVCSLTGPNPSEYPHKSCRLLS